MWLFDHMHGIDAGMQQFALSFQFMTPIEYMYSN